jgi:hypothetical protein
MFNFALTLLCHVKSLKSILGFKSIQRVKFEIFMAVKIWNVDFSVMMPCSLVKYYKILDEYITSILFPENGGSKSLQNVGNHPQYCTSS